MANSLGAQKIRRAVLIVALLNLAYFFVEFFGALAIGSASLFADSADFLEDTAINLFVFFAVELQTSRVHVSKPIYGLFNPSKSVI